MQFQTRFLGTNVPYDVGMQEMRAAMASVDESGPVLLLLEHAPTITITRQHGRKHVFASDDALHAAGIAIHEADRGGDVTFHGPGQLVGYPIMRLAEPGKVGDLVGYLHALEAALIDVCKGFGLESAHRIDGETGVWVGAGISEAKICAIGVGLSKGVTRHGFALNLDIDLQKYLSVITPCGLTSRGVTSFVQESVVLPSGEALRASVRAALEQHLAPFALH